MTDTVSITELQTAIDKCRTDGFTFFISMYHKKIHVTLQKQSYNGAPGMSMDVKAEGDTVEEAFRRAFANFPTNPLEGTKWADMRIAAEPGQFTETDT